MSAINNRYEFVMLFDVENGNPNGDPDAGNMPRIDSETGYGIVTDVCMKRKIRNFVTLYKEGEPYYNILIQPDKALNTKFEEAHQEVRKAKGAEKISPEEARQYMCDNYYDVRTFGAVMSTGNSPCGIVRGPVQLSFARSVDTIFPQDITITRQARTNEERRETGETEMGKKNIVPYGLYKAEGYISALLAQKVTGFNENDIELLWTAILNMFEHDRSAARGKMALRKLIVFKHDSALGNAPANELFERVRVTRKEDVEVARSYDDYIVSIDENMPEGVTLEIKR